MVIIIMFRVIIIEIFIYEILFGIECCVMYFIDNCLIYIME